MAIKNKQLREEIIETSRKLIAQYGCTKTSMSDVARKLNRVKGSLYYYFKSKDELLTAVLEKEANSISNIIIGAVNQETDPIKKLKVYAMTRLTQVKKTMKYYKLVLSKSPENSELVRNIEKKAEEENIKIIKDILRYGEKKNVFSLKNIDLIAYAVFTQLRHLEHPLNLEIELEKQKGIVDDLLQILFYGIVKK